MICDRSARALPGPGDAARRALRSGSRRSWTAVAAFSEHRPGRHALLARRQFYRRAGTSLAERRPGRPRARTYRRCGVVRRRGLSLARLINPPGASAYVLGGVVAYSDDVKVTEVGVEWGRSSNTGLCLDKSRRSWSRARAQPRVGNNQLLLLDLAHVT
jgi:hypothetical protein